MRTPHIVAVFLVAGALAACDQEEETATDGNTELANPASVFCVEQGGKSEIRTGDDGGQVGICVLADGQEVDEWEYFREHHPEAESSSDGG